MSVVGSSSAPVATVGGLRSRRPAAGLRHSGLVLTKIHAHLRLAAEVGRDAKITELEEELAN